MDRRNFIRYSGAVASAALLARARQVEAQDHAGHGQPGAATHGHGQAGAPKSDAPRAPVKVARATPIEVGRLSGGYGQPAVITPNGTTLPWRIVNGVKVGHLVAAPVQNEFAPGLSAECWGYNGSTPGPTIEAIAGD